MEAFETASTGHRGLAVFDFLVRVKARVNSIHFGTMWAAVLYIMFHCLEISFFIKSTNLRMNFLFSSDPLGRSNVGFLQKVGVSRLNDQSLRCALQLGLAPSVVKLTGWLRCSLDSGCLFTREDVRDQCTLPFDSDLGAWPILAHVLCFFSLLEFSFLV